MIISKSDFIKNFIDVYNIDAHRRNINVSIDLDV